MDSEISSVEFRDKIGELRVTSCTVGWEFAGLIFCAELDPTVNPEKFEGTTTLYSLPIYRPLSCRVYGLCSLPCQNLGHYPTFEDLVVV